MTNEQITFEQALEKLEQIVSRIEEGQVPLEESIEQYAQGIELIKRCREILNAAEKKIQLLAKDEAVGLKPAGELDQDDESR